MARQIRVALTGTPGFGKTALFNALTGSRQHVGNRSGVAVETIVGRISRNGCEVEVVDLPGTYSLAADSVDEAVVRDFILDEKPVVVVQVVDATNLERSLYLTTQLAELGVPILIVLNMADTAEAQDDPIDRQRLSVFLDLPVVCMAGARDDGPGDLLDAVIEEAEASSPHGRIVDYGEGIEATIASLVDALSTDRALTGGYPLRWLAVKLLEGDENASSKVRESPAFARVQVLLSSISSDEYASYMAERRYQAIMAILLHIRGAGDGVLGSPDHVDDVPCRCSVSSCCCGESVERGVVEYILTEKGKRFAGRLAGMKES